MPSARPNRKAAKPRKTQAAPKIGQMVTFIYASDPPASWRFYEGALGLDLVLDQGGCRIYRVAGEAFLGVCKARAGQTLPTGEGRDKGAILTLVVADAAAVAAWGKRLARGGVRLDTKPHYNPDYDIDHLFARDPDGYWVEIQAFRSKTWPRPKGSRAKS